MDLSERANMRDREVRTFDAELRAVSEGRTIEGLAAPFNSPTTIRDMFGEYQETIMPGAFTRTVQDRAGKIKLLAQHDRSSFPLGNIPRLWETTDGLRMEAVVANTTAGNDALTLVNERVVNGLSIGFQVVRQEWNADYTARSIHEIKLMEISLVTEPAYAEAGVTAVRSAYGIDLDAVAAIAKRAAPLTYGDKRAVLQAAVIEAFGSSGIRWIWLRDFTDEWVVYEVEDADTAGLFQVDYSMDDAGNVTFGGDPVEVVAQTSYVPRSAEIPQSIREDLAKLYELGVNAA